MFGCSNAQKLGGVIPAHFDEYIFTTEERYFLLKENLFGTILKHQTAYSCDIDSIIYNSTSIVKLEGGDTLTVYSPCLMTKFDEGNKVNVEPVEFDSSKDWTKREIYVQFKKGSYSYPLYQCLSCRYANTVGKITLAK